MLLELLLLCVGAIFLLHLYLTLSRKFRLVNKIPGPLSLPIIGNIHHFLGSREELFREERKKALTYYPFYKIHFSHIAAVVLYRPEDLEVILSSTKHITKNNLYDFLHPWLGTGLLTSTGSKWQTRRKILTPAFHFNILQDFITIFHEETQTLVKELKKQCHKEYIDIIPPITQFTLVSVAKTAMGVKLSQINNDYKNAIYELGKLFSYRVFRPWLYTDLVYDLFSEGLESKRLVKTLHDFSWGVIKERQKNFQLSYAERKKLAMLDLLLKAKEEGANIDEEGIREEVDTFMFEGHDTTSIAICFTLLLLANNRKAQEQILEEMSQVLPENSQPTYNDLQNLKYMERCIKESLRLFPSVPVIGRVADEDFQTSEYTIPKGINLDLSIYDLHHNPKVWPDPERFDPDRFLPENTKNRHPFAYLPFSAGPRNCIGQKFAMLELKAVLWGILREFELKPVDKTEDIVFVSDLVLRTEGEIRVKFTARKL